MRYRIQLSLLPLLFLLLSFGLVFYPVIAKLITSWMLDKNYSHGFFIPFISLYFVWRKREILNKLSPKGENWGLGVVGGGLLLLIFAWMASEYFMQSISMLVVLYGIFIYLLGMPITRHLLFPLCYLLFMIPPPAIIWNKISIPLSLFASTLASNLMRLLGLVVYQEGNVIHLPDITLQVVNICSGLRSLVSMMAIGAALGYLSPLNSRGKWCVFLFSIPVAIVGNVLRLTITGLLCQSFGPQMARGVIHEVFGWMIFVVGFILLMALSRVLEKIFPLKDE